MSLRRVLALLAGSVAVHLAVVACGSADGPVFGPGDSDAGAAGAGGGAEPEVAVEACDRVTSSGIPVHYAAHSYPGRTAAELGRVSASAKYKPSFAGSIEGYDSVQVPVLLKDGGVAVTCGDSFETVTFLF